MHTYTIPESVRARVIGRQGRMPAHETIDASRTALVVVDMQNYFVAEGFPAYVPLAKTVVPNINRIASAMRAARGLVVWIQTTASGALEYWANHHRYMLTPERVSKRLANLAEGSEGFALWPELEAHAEDVRVTKVKYSAFAPNSSTLHSVLQRRGIDTVLVAGTATNVCCESSARDAMLLDYRVIMLADANATWTDEEHAAALNNFVVFFGDVLTVEDSISRLR